MHFLCFVLSLRLSWVFSNLSATAQIFVNFRDFPMAMEKAPERVLYLVSYLSSLPSKIRQFLGIMYEEPTGRYLPEELGEWTKSVRSVMNSHDWNGHLLVHVHKKWGHAETIQLKCLQSGADGLWASICEEGAAMGHACSSITLMNLIRMGNKKVLKQYNCSYLRAAARMVTEITTGKPVHSKQVIYGERALDIAFDFSGIAGGQPDEDEFDLAKFFGEEPPIRISSLATPQMILKNLQQSFGHQKEFTVPRTEKMKEKIMEDLNSGRKEEYTSKMGIAVLYDRAGGKITDVMRSEIDKVKVSESRHQSLIGLVREIWDAWDLREEFEEAGDERLQYDSFYNGFMAPYFACYRCDDTKKGLQAIDMNCDGYIDWSEFSVYLKWALYEYPDIKDEEELLSIVFRKGIIPAMQDEVLQRTKNLRSMKTKVQTVMAWKSH